MDGGLKQRLIGAVVLVALAVIFIPILLDNQRDDMPAGSRIPPEPAAEEVREIPLNLEEAHRKVVAEQQALIGHTQPQGTGESMAPASEPVPDQEPNGFPEPSPEPAKSQPQTVQSPSAPVSPAQTRTVADTKPAEVAHADSKPAETKVTAGKPVDTKPAVAASAAKPTPASAKPARSADNGQDAIGAFLESAWVVQAGVFSNDTNARGLASKLKASGFKAFTKRTPEGTRVFVGPELDRAKAQAMLPRVQQITNVRPMVVAFDPALH